MTDAEAVAAMIEEGKAINARRIAWAEGCFVTFVQATFTRDSHPGTMHPDDVQDSLGDLLGDLMHYAKARGLDFEKALESGRSHYDHESQPDYMGD